MVGGFPMMHRTRPTLQNRSSRTPTLAIADSEGHVSLKRLTSEVTIFFRASKSVENSLHFVFPEIITRSAERPMQVHRHALFILRLVRQTEFQVRAH